ncbi:hypothetical protein [Paraburkholderia sp. BR10882]|uniref:hypothetical protein n=1 Tax=Paraburkholderia sp. BR10882 TaxID=3236991 RepID=UPI0034CDF300
MLGFGEEQADQSIVEVQNFIRQCRGRVEQDRNQGGVTPVGFIFLNLIDGGLSAFTRQTQ